MTGWNMPPGCNPSDIPGNRPEDLKEEGFWNALDAKLTEENIDSVSMQRYPGDEDRIPISDLWDDINFVKLVQIVRDLAWEAGYESGQADEAMRADLNAAQEQITNLQHHIADLEARLIEKGLL